MNGVTMQLESKTIVIHIPTIFRRRGGRRKVVLPPSGEQPAAAPQEPLLIALARAHRWQDMLDRGVAASLTELADRLKLNRSYVRRILYLALLAPDIAEAIARERAERTVAGEAEQRYPRNVAGTAQPPGFFDERT